MLSLDINHIAKVDPRNVDNLFSMWTSESIELLYFCQCGKMLTFHSFLEMRRIIREWKTARELELEGMESGNFLLRGDRPYYTSARINNHKCRYIST